MDVLFGAISVESRRRDRIVVRNNLMGSVYDGSGQHEGQYIHAVYPGGMEGKAIMLSPINPTSPRPPGTPTRSAGVRPDSESEDVEAAEGEVESFEKVPYTWTVEAE
jgi:hypothetical protein